jgi:acetyl-CoA carboxylase carboxyltransferase component
MARFLQLCDAHGLPIVTLSDTPGFLVGPQAEEQATVRHVSRLFVLGPNLDVPLCTVIVRKAYGMGGQAMAGGGFRVPDAIVAWPTGELGAMGPEGAVQLGFRRELEQIPGSEDRRLRYDSLVDEYVAGGRAVNAASVFELDDVIDPSETRVWITQAIDGHDWSTRVDRPRRIDTW